MRFAYLGSGSRGNAALISSGDTTLLLDCGFSVAETERRLARLGTSPTSIHAILVTHEHADHISGVALLARRYRIPVWLTSGTHAAWTNYRGLEVHLFNAHRSFEIDGIQVHPFPVPHDAREPAQFAFSDGTRRIGVLSDTGHITAHIREHLSGCDALLLECNHDVEMLESGPYPSALKRRVGGQLGHLSNAQTAGLLTSIDVSRLQHLLIAHISEKNNTPQLARQALAGALGCAEDWIPVISQDDGLDWREVS